MLNGKTAVVTGGSRGIGKAIALRFAQNGANIAVVYSGNTDAAAAICEEAMAFGVNAQAFQCNVADYMAVKQACAAICEAFGGVDILVNNAGITRDTLLLRMSESQFDDVIAVNLKGAFNVTKQLSRTIMKAGAGRIINISSISGLMGNRGQANYAAAKAGLIGFTKSVARELAGKQVTCNAIAPGFIETDMTASLPRQVLDWIDDNVPLGHMGTPNDIAAAALFLASPAASYITGAVLQVDGGMYM